MRIFLLRIMRLTALFLFLGSMGLSAKTISQTVTFSGKNVSLEKAFDAIRTQTGYFIVGDMELLNQSAAITISVVDCPLTGFLDEILRGQPFTYVIERKTIAIKPKNLTEGLKTGLNNPHFGVIAAPPITVRGKIVNENGDPVIASVLVKGTNRGVTSKADGSFEITGVENNAVLVISAANIETKEIKLSGKADLSVLTVKIKSSPLDEVQVIAYGTSTQRLSTGNITKVTAEQIEAHPVGNVLAALDGQVPGMLVTQSNGLPGASFKVSVRGRTAIDRNITDDNPLFIIDGVPYAPNNNYLTSVPSSIGNPSVYATQPGGISPFNLINPKDIESIEVLKDADATAIYGSRGANGVILITTKLAARKKESTRVDFHTYNGVSMIPNLPKMMSTEQYTQVRKQAFQYDEETPDESNAYDILLWDTTFNNHIYKKIFNNNAHNNDAQLSLSGGNETTGFQLSGSYHRETNLYSADKADKRATLYVGLQHRSLNNRLHITFTGSYASDKNGQLVNNLGAGYYLPPNQKIYNDDGSLSWEQNGVINYTNPMSELFSDYLAHSTTTMGNLLIDYELLKDLHVKTSAGFNNVNVNESSLLFAKADVFGRRFASFAITGMNSWIVEPQLEFRKNIYKGALTILAGATWQDNKNNADYTDASGYSSDALMNSLANAANYYSSNSMSEYRYSAGFARISYNWANKYLLNASLRRDASSRFGPGRQLATFSAIGLGWIFTEEEWVKKNIGALSFGKLRGSYGLTGNDKISNYQYLDTWESGNSIYGDIIGLYPNKLFNPDYRWEKTGKKEIGLELGFLKDRILFSISRYENSSTNQLVNYTLPALTGFTSVIANLNAKVLNAGWEIVLNTVNVRSADWTWKSSFNISAPRNKLVSFPGLSSSPYRWDYVVGMPLNISYSLYHYLGVDPQMGLFKVEDKNKDGQITYGEDATEKMKLDPSLFGGFRNSVIYRQFSIDLLFSFRAQKAQNYLSYIQGFGSMNNMPAIMYGKFWQKPGDDAALQKPTQSYSTPAATALQQFKVSDGGYSNASYIRLRNISVSYNLPENLLQRWHLANARIYMQAENLFKITSYQVTDPETGGFNIVPPLKTFVWGVQLGLK